VAEDVSVTPVVQEQRREQADERRLAGAVLAEDRDALAALDLEGDVLDRDALPRAETLPADELLAQIVNFDGVHLLLQTRRRDRNGFVKKAHRRANRRRARTPESAEEQHRRPTIANPYGRPQVSCGDLREMQPLVGNAEPTAQSEERAARNEVAFRRANETLEEKPADPVPDRRGPRQRR